MPELPEVETLARDLRRTIVGKTIVDVAVGQPKAINLPLEQFRERVRGKVSGVDRHGKEVLVHLPAGELGLHLGLGGSVQFLRDAPWPTGKFVSFRFDNGEQLSLDKVFMGHAHFTPAESVKREAPDALDSSLTADRFVGLLRRKPRLAVKAALMDQRLLAGIGNTYSDEILLHGRVHPATRIAGLDDDELRGIYRSMRDVLDQAVAAGGEADWHDFAGEGGRFPFAVHGVRQCGLCGGPTKAIDIGGRTAYICPHCQPESGGDT